MQGPGQQISSHRPSDELHKTWFAEWMFTQILGTPDTSVTDKENHDIMIAALFGEDTQSCTEPNDQTMDLGRGTWDWPALPLCKSKPITPINYPDHVARMPFLIWIGGNRQDSRSQAAILIRSIVRNNKGIMWQTPRCRGSHCQYNDDIKCTSGRKMPPCVIRPAPGLTLQQNPG